MPQVFKIGSYWVYFWTKSKVKGVVYNEKDMDIQL